MTTTESRIFVVDDESDSREWVQALATQLGLASEGYASAEDFLDCYVPEKAGCLVTDLRMTGMSGLELLRTMKERRIAVPTIVLTGDADVPTAVETIRQGACTLLEKPCRETDLGDAIREALAMSEILHTRQQRQQEFAARMASLTDQERQVMALIVDGVPNKTIATRLHMSLRTIEGRRKEVFRKTSTKCVAELVNFVMHGHESPCTCKASLANPL